MLDRNPPHQTGVYGFSSPRRVNPSGEIRTTERSKALFLHTRDGRQPAGVAAKHLICAEGLSVCMGVSAMVTMLAYFDPGAGSLLMQLLLGGVGGLAIFGQSLWRHFFTQAPSDTGA